MQARDRSLQHVGASAAQRQGTFEPGAPLLNLVEVPDGAVLVFEEDEGAVDEAGFAPGVVHEHQREQSVHVGFVRHQLGERTSEPDRLGREVASAAVALVEDQVDDGQDCGEAVGQQVRGRYAKRDPGGLDLLLRPDEPLRHRRFGDEERAGDLLRRQAAERPQRERDLGLERERRMTAGEDELEALVGNRRLVHVDLRRFRHLEQAGLRRQRAVAANSVDRAVASRRHEPGARARGRSVTGPALGGSREGLLSGFLSEVEVAQEADQCGEDASPLVAEDSVEDRLVLPDRAHFHGAAHPGRRDP